MPRPHLYRFQYRKMLRGDVKKVWRKKMFSSKSVTKLEDLTVGTINCVYIFCSVVLHKNVIGVYACGSQMYIRGIIRTISPSTKFSLQSSDLDPPASECTGTPPPPESKGEGQQSLACEGAGGSQFGRLERKPMARCILGVFKYNYLFVTNRSWLKDEKIHQSEKNENEKGKSANL
jgi:hypothetical protein